MLLQKNNFGLMGQRFQLKDDAYDNLFQKFKDKRAEKKEDKKDRKDTTKQRKDDKRDSRVEKKELGNEKRRLKNDMKQTQIDEKKSQIALIAQQSAQPTLPPLSAPKDDNTLVIVVSVVVVMGISLVGWMKFRKQNPGPPLMPKTA